MKQIIFISMVLTIMLLSACGTPTVSEQPSQSTTTTTNYSLKVSVSPTGAGSVSPPGGTYESGLQVTLTATPASGYTFDYWEGSASGSLHTVTIAMNSNKSITAHFKTVETKEVTLTKYTLGVSVSPTGAGSVSPPGGTYESGHQVTLTATPASGYTFDYWDGASSSTSPTVTITMNSNKSITAHFKTSLPPKPEPQTSRTNPAGLNQVVRAEVDDWLDGKLVIEMEMLEIISGDQAWSMISAWNMFNDPPGAGKEYIIVKFRVKIIEAEKEPYDLYGLQFDAYSATGVEYTDWASVAGEDPELDANLFEGAEHIGYTSFLVRTDDSPVAVYRISWDENAMWFDLRAR